MISSLRQRMKPDKKILYFFLLCALFILPGHTVSHTVKVMQQTVMQVDSLRLIKDASLFTIKNDPWVEEKLASMTIEEKAGQLVFPYVYGRYLYRSKRLKKLEHYVKDLHVGGFVYFKSKTSHIVALTNKLQKMTDIPLLMTSDFERGVPMRATDGTAFPYNMALGSVDDVSLARQMGQIIADESKAIGIFMNFAPVADINNNPNNPIINIRSFGERTQLVSRLTSAVVEGLQDNGVISTVKHFPGHGNTETDTHRDVAVIRDSKNSIEKNELVPFTTAINNGVMAVMLGHLGLPAYGTGTIPATLSKEIVSGLLIEELGFQGLIVTDAMNMRAITRYYTPGQAAIAALNAGIDIILYPDDVEETISAIIDAVRDGTISEERLDHSVRKVLLAKRWAGLTENRFVNSSVYKSLLEKPGYISTARTISRKSITLVKNDGNLIPVNPNAPFKFAHIVVQDSRDNDMGNQFNNHLKERIKDLNTALINNRSDDDDYEKAFDIVRENDFIFLSVYLKMRDFRGSISLEKKQAELIDSVFDSGKPVILLSHGNPYLLSGYPDASTYLCNYGNTEITESAFAEALFGEIEITGKLPVSIPNTPSVYGDGIKLLKPELDSLLTLTVLEQDKEEEEIIIGDSLDFTPVDTLVESAIEKGFFPAAVVLVEKDGKVLYNKGYGRLTYADTSAPVTPETIFDLASVSKVIGTTTAAMLCYDRGLFALDDFVAKYIPEFGNNGKDSITIRHLLTHTSGLIPFRRYYAKYDNADDVIADIYSDTLTYPIGSETKYSDLNMIVLAKLIERVGGMPFDEFCRTQIFEPLGMNTTFYNPPDSLHYRCAPTEVDDYWRKRLLIGEVHDEAASLLDGVAGHAGLFSISGDLVKLLTVLLDKGEFNGKQFIKKKTVELFTKRQSSMSTRGLGWDTKSRKHSSAGDFFSDNSFGHTGYTGTSVWNDPKRKVTVILLTNRVHPTRENTNIISFRPGFHNAVMKVLFPELGTK